MTTFCICLELRRNGLVYEPLTRYLESFVSFAQATPTTWFVKASAQPSEIRDEIEKHLFEHDRAIVVAAGAACSYTGLQSQTADWIQSQWNK